MNGPGKKLFRKPILEVRDLFTYYGAKKIHDGISFRIHPGSVTAILGGSGCGKTTLMKVLIGLHKPTSGTIELDGQSLTGITEAEFSEIRKQIGVCFQGGALFNSMTTGENVALPLIEHQRLAPDLALTIARIKLGLVGLSEAVELYPSELSGGMKKRAALARAMAMDPKILFLDEPSAGLDPIVAAELDALIRKLVENFGTTVIVITHELQSINSIADRVIMLDHGKIVAHGRLDDVKRSDIPVVRNFFNRTVEKSDDAYLEDAILL